MMVILQKKFHRLYSASLLAFFYPGSISLYKRKRFCPDIFLRLAGKITLAAP